MTILSVPALEAELWPTLGPQMCDFIEEWLIHGPGDIRGRPVVLDDEQRFFTYRMYEVYPRRHEMAGRRRFKRAALSLRKGVAKTEFAAWIAACELHPDAPVRCVSWKGEEPVGGGVTDPYIPMVGYTEEATEELAYGALLTILSEGPLAGDFDIGLERIMRKKGDGKAVALATAPNAREGARTTFQHFDETWLFILPRLVTAHGRMLANIPKRKAADAWSLETSTAPEPGRGSVAEQTMEYARQVAEGKIKDTRLFFFHRQASEEHDLTTEKGARAAVLEASGSTAAWTDLESIIELWRDPTTDRAHWERVWTNRLVRSSERAFDVERWKELAAPKDVDDGALITLGFDGARYEDATALAATEVLTGYQWLVGVWEKPHGVESWSVPEEQVDAAVEAAFERWDVWRLYADPLWWESWLARWAGRWGKRVMEWPTNRPRQMAFAVSAFQTAVQSGELSHDGNADLARHIGAACRREVNVRDEKGQPLWTIQKERHDSPFKIDAAMAAILSWEARNDAIAAGVGEKVGWTAV